MSVICDSSIKFDFEPSRLELSAYSAHLYSGDIISVCCCGRSAAIHHNGVNYVHPDFKI